jgi:hypothetical protein
MAKKRVFISFDYDNDEGAKIMLAAKRSLTIALSTSRMRP